MYSTMLRSPLSTRIGTNNARKQATFLAVVLGNATSTYLFPRPGILAADHHRNLITNDRNSFSASTRITAQATAYT
jgi:hypothetical protein